MLLEDILILQNWQFKLERNMINSSQTEFDFDRLNELLVLKGSRFSFSGERTHINVLLLNLNHFQTFLTD